MRSSDRAGWAIAAMAFSMALTTSLHCAAPFGVDVTDALKPGANVLQIKVTNLWVNRLIGDQQAEAQEKFTYTTQVFYKANAPLLPSGQLGPVQIQQIKR